MPKTHVGMASHKIIYDVERAVLALGHLAAGCDKHPAYRAIRPPRGSKPCVRCKHLYDLKMELVGQGHWIE